MFPSYSRKIKDWMDVGSKLRRRATTRVASPVHSNMYANEERGKKGGKFFSHFLRVRKVSVRMMKVQGEGGNVGL
jgi:hypothetical protein